MASEFPRLGVSVQVLWGTRLVGAHFVPMERAHRGFRVGGGPAVDFVTGARSSHEVIRSEAGEASLCFTRKMHGAIHRDGKVRTLEELRERGLASECDGGYRVPLEKGSLAWVELGGLRVQACIQRATPIRSLPWGDRLDFTALNTLLAVFFVAGLFVVSALNRQLEEAPVAEGLARQNAAVARYLPAVSRAPLNKRVAEEGRRAGGPEGKAGREKETQRQGRHAERGEQSSPDRARKMLGELFNAGGRSSVFGEGGLGGTLKSAVGGLVGASVGPAHGFGGLGLRGADSGGGMAGGPIGIGGLGIRGRGTGDKELGEGPGFLGKKLSPKIPDPIPGDLVLDGALDRELIRGVIRRNISQVRYCYEERLTVHPDLAGKVLVQFVISATGQVVSSAVQQSTAQDAKLEQCVASRVQTWLFPKPKGGGTVTVKYPFLFKQAGR